MPKRLRNRTIPSIHNRIPCRATRQEVDLTTGKEECLSCPETTSKGYLCKKHAKSKLGLEITTSTIANSGDGLFCVGRGFRKGDVIDEYAGPLMTKTFYSNFCASDYALDVANNMIINPMYSTDSFARYANDKRSKDGNNAELLSPRTLVSFYKKMEYANVDEHKAYLVASKPIARGEEIFCPYAGSKDTYWTEKTNNEQSENNDIDEKEELPDEEDDNAESNNDTESDEEKEKEASEARKRKPRRKEANRYRY